MIKPEIFDIVELIVNIPEKNLYAGLQGTILEDYGDSAYEVEFTNDDGETICLSSFTANQFIVVWQNSTKQWLSLTDKLTSILNKLSEQNQQEVFNFARFIAQK